KRTQVIIVGNAPCVNLRRSSNLQGGHELFRPSAPVARAQPGIIVTRRYCGGVLLRRMVRYLPPVPARFPGACTEHAATCIRVDRYRRERITAGRRGHRGLPHPAGAVAGRQSVFRADATPPRTPATPVGERRSRSVTGG